MSAPEVGDRVRVIAGQWTGWEGVVIDRYKSPSGRHWRIVEHRTQGGCGPCTAAARAANARYQQRKTAKRRMERATA